MPQRARKESPSDRRECQRTSKNPQEFQRIPNGCQGWVIAREIFGARVFACTCVRACVCIFVSYIAQLRDRAQMAYRWLRNILRSLAQHVSMYPLPDIGDSYFVTLLRLVPFPSFSFFTPLVFSSTFFIALFLLSLDCSSKPELFLANQFLTGFLMGFLKSSWELVEIFIISK